MARRLPALRHEHGDIAGGVIVVVKDGEVLAQKGYGYADVATKKPVDPERTLFRAGSVAKLVTHTAVMQLVEQGKLDLDGDIAQYLDFPVPDANAFGKPVTLHNLMTHTGGFEELVRGLMASDPKVHMPLETYVKATKPTRIFPPGEVPSYCNYCVTLEGYIVQRVSGEELRRLSRRAHLRAARHEQLHVPPAAAEAVRRADVDGLSRPRRSRRAISSWSDRRPRAA